MGATGPKPAPWDTAVVRVAINGPRCRICKEKIARGERYLYVHVGRLAHLACANKDPPPESKPCPSAINQPWYDAEVRASMRDHCHCRICGKLIRRGRLMLRLRGNMLAHPDCAKIKLFGNPAVKPKPAPVEVQAPRRDDLLAAVRRIVGEIEHRMIGIENRVEKIEQSR